MAEKKLSVQICSFNRKHLLSNSVASLFDQTCAKEDYEIIVVDDGSSDGTAEMVKNLKSPVDLIFIRQEKEGLAAGRNKGILKARGEIILFIDDDVLADPHLIEEHLRFHKEHPNSVVKGWVNHVTEFRRPEKPVWTMKDFSSAFFWTSNVSVKKADLMKAGLFDETFKEYGWEDLELGLRLKRLSLQSRINRHAIGYHYKRSAVGSDLSGKLAQAEAKGRTAVIFVERAPNWRARLATGVYPLRLGLDRILSNRFFLKLYKKSIPSNGKPLSAWSNYCLNALATATYFNAVRQALVRK